MELSSYCLGGGSLGAVWAIAIARVALGDEWVVMGEVAKGNGMFRRQFA